MKEAIRFKINRRDYLKQYETVFLKPIAEGQNAVPVGNGDLAALRTRRYGQRVATTATGRPAWSPLHRLPNLW